MYPQPGRFRPIAGLGSAFVSVAALALVLQWVATGVRWYGYHMVKGRVDGDIDSADYRSARETYGVVEVASWFLSFPVMLVASILLVAWLWRARANTDLFSAHAHRLSRPWAIWSWVTPIVVLWFPAVFVDDVDRASTARARGDGSIALWWASWLLSWFAFWAMLWLMTGPTDTIQTMTDTDIDGLLLHSVLRTVTAVSLTVAGGFLFATVSRISRAQAVWAPR